MDPNSCLEEMRGLLPALLDEPDGTAEGLRLAELVEALDDWLSKGGFLPDAWNRRRT